MKQSKRVFLFILLFALVMCLASFGTAHADSVTYIDADRTTKTAEATPLTDQTTWSGWYVASGTVNISERVTVSGTAHLILTDGSQLSIPAGITVSENNSLTIYGQSGNTGVLTINGVAGQCAGIGGVSWVNGGIITINGGTLNVTGGSSAAAIGGGYEGSGGTITINGGNVTATGIFSGKGIGNCKEGTDYGSATIIINGGTVSATGGSNGTGINSGRGTITIGWTDETDSVTANRFAGTMSIKDGQMMTDGTDYYSGTLTSDQKTALRGKTLQPVPTAHTVTIGTITGGSVTADKTLVLAGETVTLTTGTGYRIVSAKFNDSDITIGANGAGTFTMPNENVTVTATVEKIPHTVTIGTVMGGTVTADKTTAGIDDTVTLTTAPNEGNTLYSLKASYTDSNNTEHSLTITGGNNTYTFTMPAYDVSVSAAFSDGVGYTDGNGDGQTTKKFAWLESNTTSLTVTEENGGWYSAQENLTVSGRVTVTGDVKLILLDGVTLTIPKGITVEGDNKLTIYGQVLGTGALTINSVDDGYAGIGGGGSDKAGGVITINGGTVNVAGGYMAAAIGGGTAANGGTITINGGKVTATNESGYSIGTGLSFIDQLEATINLGWTHEDDFIDSGIYSGTVTFSKNFQFDGTTTVATPQNIIGGGKIVPCTSAVYTVTFDSKGGSEVDAQKIMNGQTATVPAKPMKQGNKFGGWYRDDGLAEAYDFGTAVTGDITLYAKWDTPEAISYINANGETVSDITNYTPIESNYTNLTAGFWYVGEDVVVDDRIIVNGEVSIILGHGATLTASSGISVTGGNTLNVFADSSGTGRLIATFSVSRVSAAIGSDWDLNGGTTTGTINIYGGQITATQSSENGKAIGASYQATSSGTVTLGYTHAEDFIEATSYGGTVTVATGKTFLADGTEISGAVNDLTAIDGKKLTPKGVLTLTLPASFTNGYVTSDREKFFVGDTVTLRVTPNPGYEVKSVKYGNTDATKNNDGTYSFVMPEGGAEVSAEFSAVEYTITYELDGGTVATANPITYTVETETFTLTNPTKDGATFAGWTGTGLNEATMTVTIATGSTGARSYTATWTGGGSTPDFTIPTFSEKHSVILEGEIGLKFYVYLPVTEGIDYTNSYMEFDISGDKSNELKYYKADNNRNIDGNMYHYFTCYMSSVQMADKITATFHYGDNLSVSQEYSVKEYLDNILEGNFSTEAKDLMTAIQDYGHFAQQMLSKANGWTIGKEFAEMPASFNDASYNASEIQEARDGVKDYAIVRNTGDSGIEKVEFSLLFDSKTTINVYLTVKSTYAGTVSATFNGTEAQKLSDGRYFVQIRNIPAHELATMYEINVTAGSSFTVKVAALSYVDTMINKTDATIGGVDLQTMKNAVTAFYRYYAKAIAYQNSLTQ